MDSKVLGIALESSAVPFLQPTPSAGNVKIMHLSQHKRNGRFTETLVKHGFARDTSLFAASRASERRIIRTKHRFESMDSLVEEFHREVAELFGIQNELIRLQKMMATRALEVFSVRVIQQAVRSWVARHKLMMLKLSRFICDRVYFLRYYKRRVKAACRLAMRILMFLARRTLKIHLKRKNSAIRIQKLYNKWKLLRAIKFRIIVLGKMGRLLKHVMLFGKCRAIMHMRRLDVQRVQEEEQAQYTALLALEQQRQAEEELKAAEELKRLEQEALKKARAKMIAAAKKQAKEAALVAAVHGKGKRAKGKNIAPTSATLSTAIENDISAIEAAAQLAAAQVVANSLAHKVAVESEPPVDHYTAPVSTVLIIQAVSAGIITGQNTSQVMHNWVINRYGSVYGGMYGEYCCVGDNRVRSFAAVRFRFMLRCFRKKRLKALNGPNAKTFFYMLSHLNNTPNERKPNVVVQGFQTLIRTYAIRRAAQFTSSADASIAGSGGMGKMLLSSYRRTKLNSSMDLGNILGSATSADIVPQVSLEETNVDESGSAGAFFVTQKPFGSATTSAKLNASQDNSAFSTGQTITNVSSSGRETRKATYPTYTAESFPTCFVTGSYRPRTLAELVLMLIDMKRAVIKTPSLVDDNTPPAAKTSVKVNPKAAAAINVMMRGGAKKKTASATLGASSTAHKAESAPPPLIRGDSGISGAAKLKSALASASPASAISAAVHVSAANKGSPASKGVPQYVSLPENAPSADVNHSGKESAVRVSEVVPLAKVGKSGSFQSKLVPSAPAPLVKQHSGMGSQLQGVADGRASIAVTVVANVISTENAMHMNTGNVGNGGGGGAGSVPAQLRANNRVLRPSSVVITTPAPVPAPYPFAPTAATTTATSTGSANATTDSRSSTPQKLQVDANLHVQLHEHTHRDQIEDSKSIQGITPSAIIAAAKATLRDAETTVMPNEPVRRQSLSSRGRQLSALLESSSKRTPNARTPKSSTTTEVESNFLGSVEEKIHLNIDF